MRINPYILLLFLSMIVASLSQILLKKGALREHHSFYGEYLNPYVICGYAMLVLTTLINILAFSKGVEFKNAPVIEALGFVLVMVLSRVFFEEKITLRKSVGNILILLGVVVFYL